MSNRFSEANSLQQLLRMLDEQHITGHRRYAEIRSFICMKAREKAVPVSGFFELTPLCNLDCKMCYVHLNKEQMGSASVLPTETWISLIDQAVAGGMLYASLSGGECLTHPGFKDIYMHLISRGIQTEVYTNCVALQGDMLDLFRRYPPAMIHASLYGASEDSYERVTGSRAFGRVMRNMTALRDAGLPFSVNVTPSRYMTDGEQILRLLNERGFQYKLNPSLITPREETGRGTEDATQDEYVALYRLMKSLSGGTADPGCDPDDLPRTGGDAESPLTGLRCGGGRSSFSVNWNGIMRPCPNFMTIGENVLSLGFTESWQRVNAAVKQYPLPVECEGCAYSRVCSQCAVLHACGAAPGHASPHVCSLFRRLVAEGLEKI